MKKFTEAKSEYLKKKGAIPDRDGGIIRIHTNFFSRTCPACGSRDVEKDKVGVIECNNCGGYRVGKDMWWAGGEDYEESSMKDNKRVREGAPEFEPEDDEFEDDEEMAGDELPDEEEEEFEGEAPEGPPADDEEFEDEEEECEGESGGEIVIDGRRYCITLTPMDEFDDEETEEEEEGESEEEEAEEGEEGEAEEEAAEHESGENPFAARDEELEEEELEEAIRLGMSDRQILELFGEVAEHESGKNPFAAKRESRSTRSGYYFMSDDGDPIHVWSAEGHHIVARAVSILDQKYGWGPDAWRNVTDDRLGVNEDEVRDLLAAAGGNVSRAVRMLVDDLLAKAKMNGDQMESDTEAWRRRQASNEEHRT